MKELIKITTNKTGQKLVIARDLHEGLEIKSKYQDWINRMFEYGFEKDIDYITWTELTQKKEGSRTVKRLQTNHYLTLDMAKEISMLQRNELGRKFRQYFIECEKQLIENRPKLPNNYKEVLIALVAEIEEKEKIQAEKQKLIHDNKTYTASEIAKELHFRSAQELNKDLAEKKIQYKVNNVWVLAARYSELGYTKTKQIELNAGKIIYDTRWSGKGRDWLINDIYKERD